MEWARLLQRPVHRHPPEYYHLSRITFLELMINYVICSKRLPPARTTLQGRQCHVDPLQEKGMLHLVVLRESLVSFRPSARRHRLHCLGCSEK